MFRMEVSYILTWRTAWSVIYVGLQNMDWQPASAKLRYYSGIVS